MQTGSGNVQGELSRRDVSGRGGQTVQGNARGENVQEIVPKMKCPWGELSRGSVWGKVKGNCAGCKMSGGQLSVGGNVWEKLCRDYVLEKWLGEHMGSVQIPMQNYKS